MKMLRLVDEESCVVEVVQARMDSNECGNWGTTKQPGNPGGMQERLDLIRYGRRRASMSEMRRQRGSAGRRFATPCKPLGVLPRWLAALAALERQPQRRSQVCAVRHRISAAHESFQNRVGAVHSCCPIDRAGILGRTFRRP